MSDRSIVAQVAFYTSCARKGSSEFKRMTLNRFVDVKETDAALASTLDDNDTHRASREL